MTKSNEIKVAKLEEKVDNSITANLLIANQVTRLDEKMDTLQRTIDELLGWKKATLWLIGLVGAFGAGIYELLSFKRR